MEKCIKRKYKKPLLKECLKKKLNVNEAMSIQELCSILHSEQKRDKKKEEKPKKKEKSKKKETKKNETTKKEDKHVQFIHNHFIKNDWSKKTHFINYFFSKR